MSVISRIGAAAARGFGLFGAIAAIKDAYFNYVTLLLPGNGTNGAQNNTFLDSSSNAFTITRNGNTTQGNFSPFSQTGWSYWFDGNGDYVSFGSNANTNPAGSDFTVEAWIYPLAYNSYGPVFSNDINTGFIFGKLASGFGIRQFGVGDVVFTATTPPLNQWMHVAATRSGTSWYLFYNGTIVATATASNSFTQGPACVGGDASTATEAWNGYLSNVRFIKGTALYTSNFTPSTAPLTAVSGTQLLTCQSNRFLDNSSNAYAATAGGSASVQAFSPFAPTAAWSASTNGGSGYFDGSGDYLTAAANAAFATPGDFTWEAWVYRTSTTDDVLYTGNTTNAFIVQIISNNVIVRQFGVSDLITSSGTVPANAWTHIAVARSGTTLSLWINGSRSSGGTTTNSTSFAQNGLLIGVNDISTNYLDGYLSNLRLVKGTAVYDPTQTTITVPTAPLTAISGTSLLLSYTNGGIVDATAKNDLETVGNAQISTTQSKFGGSSMAFDGSGDYLVANSGPSTSQRIGFGTNDFTVEAWVYCTSSAVVNNGIYEGRYSASATCFTLYYIPNSALCMAYSGANQIVGTTFTINTWNHVALVRYNGVTKLYLNGTQTGGSYTDTNNYTSGANSCIVGALYDGSGSWNGYIDDLRVTRSIARYTSNFTPPTSAFLLQ